MSGPSTGDRWRLLDECGACIVLLDGEGRVREVNRPAREALGVGHGDVGLPLAATSLPGRFDGLLEDVAALREPSAGADRGPGPAASARQRMLETVDGRAWLLRVNRPCPGAGEMVLAFIDVSTALAHARSDPDRAGATLQEAAARTSELASLGTLAAGIAHEINNPLNAILMNAELGLLTLDEGSDRARLRRALETIIDDVKRCADLTTGVLQLARERASAKRSADLNEVVREARRLVDGELQLRDATIELELSDLPPAPLDAPAMEGAVVNLLTNAARAGESGVRIRVRSRLDRDRLLLSVEDDGVGIAGPDLERIFDPYFTTGQGNGGTGLGLGQVHATVTDHGGTIEVRSRPGQGTEVVVRLPAGAGAGR